MQLYLHYFCLISLKIIITITFCFLSRETRCFISKLIRQLSTRSPKSIAWVTAYNFETEWVCIKVISIMWSYHVQSQRSLAARASKRATWIKFAHSKIVCKIHKTYDFISYENICQIVCTKLSKFKMVKRYFKNLLTVYETTKVVGVKSPIVAVVHILLVTLVWCSFLISLHLDIRKIYQKTCPVHGVVLTKVKGFASTENLSDEELSVPNAEFYRRTWDPNDLVWPEQGGEGETGSFAIVTNLIITPNQTLSTCADKQGSFKCSEDSDCTQGYWSPATNGVHTGHCEYDDGTCQITGWCPPENRDLPRYLSHQIAG